jgi:hypothetical protein
VGGGGLSVETAAREGNSLFRELGLFIQFEVIQNNAALSDIRTLKNVQAKNCV